MPEGKPTVARAPMPWHAAVAAKRTELGLPQALMVVGRRGDGLLDLCRHLAETELASGDEAGGRLVAAGTHPDLHMLELEETSAGKARKNIVIGQVRSMLEVTGLSPVRARHRIAVIVPACHMNASAANALLKSLEEPNPGLKFVLGCENPAWLPATVLSRCQRLVAPRPSRDQAVSWLGDNKVKEAGRLLDLAGGAPLDAIESLDLLKAHEELEDICSGKKALSGRSSLDNVDIGDWLPWTIGWAAEGARSSMGLPPEPGTEPSRVARTINGKARPSALMWLDLHSTLVELMGIANHPVNKRLTLERVAWHFARLARNAH